MNILKLKYSQYREIVNLYKQALYMDINYDLIKSLIEDAALIVDAEINDGIISNIKDLKNISTELDETLNRKRFEFLKSKDDDIVEYSSEFIAKMIVKKMLQDNENNINKSISDFINKNKNLNSS